jgi:GDP-D-mannose dehydratase
MRRTSNVSTKRISHLLDKIEIINGDLTDESSLIRALDKSQPDEVYNLAAQSLVPASFEQPVLTAEITGLGVLKLLCAIRTVNPKIKFLQSSSSEMFGKVHSSPADKTIAIPLINEAPGSVRTTKSPGVNLVFFIFLLRQRSEIPQPRAGDEHIV